MKNSVLTDIAVAGRVYTFEMDAQDAVALRETAAGIGQATRSGNLRTLRVGGAPIEIDGVETTERVRLSISEESQIAIRFTVGVAIPEHGDVKITRDEMLKELRDVGYTMI